MPPKIKKYLEEKLILLPVGTEMIRKFYDTKKWISSDYKMSVPSNKSGLIKEH